MIQVYSNSQVVAETTFLLTSYEWVLVKPSASANTIIGNTLLVQAGTDIDSIVISWGDNVKHHSRIQLTPGKQPIQTFQAWKVVETEDNSEYGYSMKMAHLAVNSK